MGPGIKITLPGSQFSPGTHGMYLQGLQGGHKAIITQSFQIAKICAVCLFIRLGGDLVEQGIIQLRHIHQFCPGPFQGRPKLFHEMPHAAFAAGNTIGHECAHLGPAQPGPQTHSLVNFTDGGDAILDQPQSLTPQGFHQAIRDKAVNFLAQHQRAHADEAVDFLCPPDLGPAGLFTATDFHQGQQINRIKGVADHETFGPRHVCLQLTWQQTGR